MAVEHETLTVEQFWREYAGKPYELVNGEIRPVSPTGYEHGSTESRADFELRLYLKGNPIGDVVGGETGFWLNDDTMRAADVAFIGNEKLAQITERGKYLPFAPDLAIEVVSPNDAADEIQEKVKLYLDAGTKQVWVFYPKIREIVVHYPDGTSKRFTDQDVIDGGDVLPGFSASVTDFFPPQ